MSVCYLKSVKKRRCADVLKNQNICPGDAEAELRGGQAGQIRRLPQAEEGSGALAVPARNLLIPSSTQASQVEQPPTAAFHFPTLSIS